MNLVADFRKKLTLPVSSRTGRLAAAFLSLAVLTFIAGFSLGSRKPAAVPFHDMIVNHPREMSALVEPADRRIVALAATLKTPENAYLYVRDRIDFDPSLPSLPAGEILSEGRGSCLGKALLLCSIYRALGVKPSEVRIVTGEVDAIGGIVDHAWVEMEYSGRCLQQDATSLLGKFSFDQFRGMAYTDAFIKEEGYVFNDKGFAVVSRLNMMKGGGHPHLTQRPL